MVDRLANGTIVAGRATGARGLVVIAGVVPTTAGAETGTIRTGRSGTVSKAGATVKKIALAAVDAHEEPVTRRAIVRAVHPKAGVAAIDLASVGSSAGTGTTAHGRIVERMAVAGMVMVRQVVAIVVTTGAVARAAAGAVRSGTEDGPRTGGVRTVRAAGTDSVEAAHGEPNRVAARDVRLGVMTGVDPAGRAVLDVTTGRVAVGRVRDGARALGTIGAGAGATIDDRIGIASRCVDSTFPRT